MEHGAWRWPKGKLKLKIIPGIANQTDGLYSNILHCEKSEKRIGLRRSRGFKVFFIFLFQKERCSMSQKRFLGIYKAQKTNNKPLKKHKTISILSIFLIYISFCIHKFTIHINFTNMVENVMFKLVRFEFIQITS